MVYLEPTNITKFGLYSSSSNCVPAGSGTPFLRCTATGSPMTSLQIFNEDNKEVGTKGDKYDCEFYISNPDPSLSGNYSCKASGGYNTVVKYYELVVYGKCSSENIYCTYYSCVILGLEPVAISHFEITPSDKCVSVGSAINILCSATGIPVPSVEITFQDDVIASSLNGTAEVSFTANKSSTGRYTCHAKTPCSSKSQSSDLCVYGTIFRFLCYGTRFYAVLV